jgi:hypothetical protein
MAGDQAVPDAVLLEEMSTDIAASTVEIRTLRGRASDALHRAPSAFLISRKNSMDGNSTLRALAEEFAPMVQ